VIPAKDEEDAIDTANDTVCGLNNSVFTNDPDRAYAVARRLRSGTAGDSVFRTDFSIAFGEPWLLRLGRRGGSRDGGDGRGVRLVANTLCVEEVVDSYFGNCAYLAWWSLITGKSSARA
jgi:hypothetical protein